MTSTKRPRAGGSKQSAESINTGSTPIRNYAYIAILIGAILRVGFADRLAIEHFDEGVYASNIWFSAEQGFQYPMRHLYAPPLLPGLIEVLLSFGGRSSFLPMLPGILAGICTLVVVWKIMSRTFGELPGLVSTAVAASSQIHIEFSRTALTDSLLAFWIILAIAIFYLSISLRNASLAVVAGMLTGLAWWTKYNGWLPLAVVGVASLLTFLLDRSQWSLVRLYLGNFGLMVSAALVTWAPVIWSLNKFGGYSVVSANHSKYTGGLGDWFTNARQQLQNLAHFEGPIGFLGIFLASALAFRLSNSLARSSGPADEPQSEAGPNMKSEVQTTWLAAIVYSSILLVVTLLLGTTATLGIMGLAGGLTWLARPLNRSTRFVFPLIAIAVWFGALLVATPFYRPYARLAIPWVISTWLLGGWGLVQIARFTASMEQRQERRRLLGTLCMLATLGCVLLGTMSGKIPGKLRFPWPDRKGMARAAERIQQRIKQEPTSERHTREATIWVYGEPAVFFHLRMQGNSLANPTIRLADPCQQAWRMNFQPYLVFGPHAIRSPDFQDEWNQVGEQFQLLDEFPYETSDLVKLDSYSPSELTRAELTRAELTRANDDRIRVYRWVGKQ